MFEVKTLCTSSLCKSSSMGHAFVQAFAEHAETVANFVVADLVDAAVPSGKRKAAPALVPHMRLGFEIDRTLKLQLAAIKVLRQ